MKIEINMNSGHSDPSEQEIITVMQRDAYWAYLDFCNTVGEVPRKEIYNEIKNCKNGEALDVFTCWIESNQSDYEKKMKQKTVVKKKGFWSRIFKF